LRQSITNQARSVETGATAQRHQTFWPAITAPFALLVFLLVPGHALSFVGGLPWGPLALGCAVVLCVGLFAAWPLPSRRGLGAIVSVALALALLKAFLALTAPRYGMEASYYTNDRFNGSAERSTVTPGAPYTRIDTLLDFGNDEFPLYFFNNSERFNSNAPDRLERRRTLPWSARWVGYLNVPQDVTVALWLTASGPAELTLDRQPLMRVDAEGRATAQTQVEVAAGSHAVEVRYAKRRERSGYLQVLTDLSGQRRPLGPPFLTAEPYAAERLVLDRYATFAARGVDIGYLVLLTVMVGLCVACRVRASLAGGVSRWLAVERPLLALIPLGFFLHAAVPRLDRVGKMVFLGGGQDWLTYETFARDILINGPLMTLGEPLGQGAVYYHHQFYPYYLALLHAMTGEDLYGVTTLQVVGLGLAAVLVYELARRLFGRPSGLMALALMLGVLIPFELAWVARMLLSESLYFWLMPASILALLALVQGRRASWQLAALAGVLLALTCLTRNPTFAYLPFVGLILWHALRRPGLSRREAARTLAIVGLSAGLVIGLVPLRNVIVAGRPAILASNGGAALQIFHRLSPAVRLQGIDDDPLYQWLKVDRQTREVIEFVRQDPRGYFSTWLPLAGYTLGIGSALNHLLDEPPIQLRPGLLILNGLYLLALVVVPRARGLESGLLHAFIGVHFVCMMIFMPYAYENRPALPMYLFVTVFAAAAIVHICRAVANAGELGSLRGLRNAHA
jgi:hypothetical protein